MSTQQEPYPVLSDCGPLFKVSPVPMWIFDLETLAFLAVNEAAIREYGYSEEQFLQMTIRDIRPVEDIPRLERAVAIRKSSTDLYRQSIFRHTTANGQIRKVKIESSMVWFRQRLCELVVASDFSAEVKKQEAMIRQRTYFKALTSINSLFLAEQDWEQFLPQMLSEISLALENTPLCFGEFDSNIYYSYDSRKGLAKHPFSEFKSNTLQDTLTGESLYGVVKISTEQLRNVCGQTLEWVLGIPLGPTSKAWLAITPPQHVDHTVFDFLESLSIDLAGILLKRDSLQTLRESERRFSRLLEKGSDLIAIINSQGDYQYVSPSSHRVLGKAPDFFIGSNALEAIHPEDREHIKRELIALKEGESMSLPAYRFRLGDQEWRWIETRLTNLTQDPAIGGIVANSREITNRVLSRQALQQANDRYEFVAQASEEHIYDWDLTTGEVIRSGESFERIFGFSLNSAVHNANFWKNQVHPSDRTKVYAELKTALENINETKCIQEYRFRKGDGDFIWIRDSGYIVRDESGSAVRLVGAVRNIGQYRSRQMEERLYRLIVEVMGRDQPFEGCLNDLLKVISEETHLDNAQLWIRLSVDELVKRAELSSDGKFKVRKKQLKELFDRHNTEWVATKEGSGFWAVPLFAKGENEALLLAQPSSDSTLVGEELQQILQNISKRIAPLLHTRIAENELQDFFDITPDILCVLDDKLRVKRASTSVETVLKRRMDDILNHRIDEFLCPKDGPEFMRRLRLKEGDIENYEIRMCASDKTVRWMSWSVRYSPASNMYYGVGRENTDLREAGIQLNSAFNRLHTAQKMAHLGYWSRNLDDDLSIWSEETYAIFGYTPDNFIPNTSNIREVFYPEDRHFMDIDPISTFASGQGQFVHRLITPEGEIRWVRQLVKLLLDENGDPYKLEGTVQDITEQKEYELALERSKERFELAMKAANEMIWDWNHKTNIVKRSAAYNHELGYSLKEDFSNSNSWYQRVHRDDAPELMEFLDNFLNNTTDSYWNREYRICRLDGEVAHVVDRAYVIRDKNGKPIRSVGSVIDITESRKQMESIQKQNDALREIAWIQSHVVRAPLAKILSLIYFLEDNEEVGPELKNVLDHIVEAAGELDGVIRQISAKTEIMENENGEGNSAD